MSTILRQEHSGQAGQYAAVLPGRAQQFEQVLSRVLEARYPRQDAYLDLLAVAYALNAQAVLPESLGIQKCVADHSCRSELDETCLSLGLPAGAYRQGFEPYEIAARILRMLPHCVVELALICRTGLAIDSIVDGALLPLEALCPGGDTAMLDAFSFGSPSSLLRNTIVCSTVETIADVKKSPLRILEICAGGAGSALALSHLLSQVCSEYCYAEASELLLAAARRRLRDPALRFESVASWDSDGLGALAQHGRYDLVIATHAGRHAASPAKLMRTIEGVLAPGGSVLISGIPGTAWERLISWAASEDRGADRRDTLRHQSHSFTAADWHACLAESLGPPMEAHSSEFWPSLDRLPDSSKVFLATSSAKSLEGDSFHTETDGFPANGQHETPSARIVVTTGIDASHRGHLLAEQLIAAAELVIRGEPGVASAFLAQHGDPGMEFVLLLDHRDLDRQLLSEQHADAAADAMLEQWYGVLCFVREVLTDARAHRISVVTIGGISISGDQPSLALSGYHGLFSTTASEYANASMRAFDADPHLSDVELVDSVKRFINRPFCREELVERSGRMLHPVLTRTSLIRPKPQLASLRLASTELRGSSAGRDYALRIGRSGDFDDLDAFIVKPRALGPKEVEVEIHYAALNYRDVLKVQGEYPLDGGDYLDIGDEAAGIVSRVGSELDSSLVGRRVMVLGIGLLASQVTVDVRQLIPVPDPVSLNAATTMPVAYLTAHYALLMAGRLRSTQKVLIHAAGGGVGLAAIRVAKSFGAEVFATASASKQLAVLLWGADHVFDSRSLDFEGEVLKATGGKGVDIVLNSLAGPHQAASVRVLSEFGRFVELGKRDLYEHTTLDQYDFRRNASFHVVDMGRLAQIDSASWSQLQDEMQARVTSGDYVPLPHRCYRAVHAGQALRTMASGRHFGKILLAMQDPGVHPRASWPRTTRRYPDMCVAITGGLTGFGLAVAAAYVMVGAGQVILVSRTDQDSDEVASTLAKLRVTGRTTVTYMQGDITDPSVARRIVELADDVAQGKTLSIVHAAGVYRDEPLEKISWSNFVDVCRPKVHGALALHHAVRDCSLDTLCFISSVASMLGNGGQCSYSMANSFLDQLAQVRKVQGLPVASINMGPLADVGFLADKPKIRAIIGRLGIHFVPTGVAIKALENAMVMGLTGAGVFDIDWRQWRDQMRFSEIPAKLAHVVGSQGAEASGAGRMDIRSILEVEEPAEWTGLLEAYLRGLVAGILNVESEGIEPTANLASLGLDSLSSVELGFAIERDLGAALQVEEVGDISSVRAIARNLASRYQSQRTAQ